MNNARSRFARRYQQGRHVWREEGPRAVADRTRRNLARWLEPLGERQEVRSADVLAADLHAPNPPRWAAIDPAEPMTINWVMTPPSRGSGGHTTIFRLVQHLESRGHTCRVYLYDVYGTTAEYHEPVIRQEYPKFSGEIRDMLGGMADAHAVFATSWQTAYPVYGARTSGKRFYLVQDFEPSFYPVGAASTLAENTYRMGFHGVTAGRWLPEKLRADFGMVADSFDFGCDTTVYSRDRSVSRDGIAFFARPEAPRRAYSLGVMALELFAAARPDLEIRLFGRPVGRLPFPVTSHGLVSPTELNRLYNRSFAGLCLSMTNVSLVPHEMMAAGCLPVMNDARHNRLVLDNPHVRYAEPTPQGLASTLVEACALPDFDHESELAAKSVQFASWDDAGAQVEDVLRRELCTRS